MKHKLERIVFYIFLFAVPFQTRIILKSWGGSFNEWNSTFLYGTDILLLTVFVFWVIRAVTVQGRSGYTQPFPKYPRSNFYGYFRKSWVCTPRAPRDYFLFIFLGITALSITQAPNKLLGFYSWLKILELTGLYFYVRSSLDTVFNLRSALLAVVISGFFQSLVASGQSLWQHSLGLKWLGESILRTNFAGVAVVSAAGEKFLRAYGTTPHPNILAAWLFLAIFAFYFWYLYRPSADVAPGRVERLSLLMPFVAYPILLWGLFATFSRVAVGLLLAGIAVRFLIILLKKRKYSLRPGFKKKLQQLAAVTVAAVILFGFFYRPQVQSRLFISAQEQAVTQRVFYAKTAGEMILSRPWLGAGPGQFVGTMQTLWENYPAYFYQPVHNIYLLILNENGFLGLAAFLLWLVYLLILYCRRTQFKKLYHASFFIIFLSVLAMGLFDHFLWTLQQGQLMFGLVLGLIAAHTDK